MSGREELTAESEALLRHLAAQGYVMLAPVMDDLRAIEAAAVTGHVRETGCEGLREALKEMLRMWDVRDSHDPGIVKRRGATVRKARAALAAREEAPK